MIIYNISLIFLQSFLLSFLIVGVVGIITYLKVKKRMKNEEYFYCPECGNKVIK